MGGVRQEDERYEREGEELLSKRVPEIAALADDDPLAALDQIADLIRCYPESTAATPSTCSIRTSVTGPAPWPTVCERGLNDSSGSGRRVTA